MVDWKPASPRGPTSSANDIILRRHELTHSDVVGEPGKNDLVECIGGTSGQTGEQVGSVRCTSQLGLS